MTMEEFKSLHLGDLVQRNGETTPVADINRLKKAVNISGHWISYKNVELYGSGESSQQEPHTIELADLDSEFVSLKVNDLVKYGFPTTAILHTVERSGERGFYGSFVELHRMLPFLPLEYLRNLVPKMVTCGLLARHTICHGLFRLTLTDKR